MGYFIKYVVCDDELFFDENRGFDIVEFFDTEEEAQEFINDMQEK